MIRREQHTVVTEDGVRLAATSFSEIGARPERVSILLCAIGARQERFEPFARYLARDGWLALTFDYRGMGRSALRAAELSTASMRAWGEHDLTAVIRWVDTAFAPRRLAAVGHSIGGQILPFSPARARLDAALLVSAQRGYWRLWRGWERYGVLFFFAVYVPLCLRLFGRVPLSFMGLCDLPRGVAEDYARWGLADDYARPDGRSQTPLFAECTFPVLALSFDDDTAYAPRRSVEVLLRDYYVSAPALWCHIEHHEPAMNGLGHSGFFDPGRCPQSWWQEVSSWLATASRSSFSLPTSRRADGSPSLGSMAVTIERPQLAARASGTEAADAMATGGL